MTFIDSIQMNSRKQVSNGYDDTFTGDEQIRPVVVAPWFNKRIDDSPTGDSHALLNQCELI